MAIVETAIAVVAVIVIGSLMLRFLSLEIFNVRLGTWIILGILAFIALALAGVI